MPVIPARPLGIAALAQPLDQPNGLRSERGLLPVHVEAANPAGSYKDRMARAMIEAAEADGRLRPGQLAVEYTGGSTGSSLALVCAVKGYRLRIVSSDAFAEEKIRTMRAFGAEVELIPEPGGHHARSDPVDDAQGSRDRRADGRVRHRSVQQCRHGRWLPRAGRGTARSASRAAAGQRVLQLCRHRGLLPGVSRALAALPGLHRAVVEPAESAVLSGGPPGTHHIEGGGTGQRPPQLWPADYGEVIAVPEAGAFATARQAARDEGIFSGPSTGANLAAALDIARRPGPGHRVITMQVDSGLKYLTGQLYS